jgi:hypothetical protein
MTQAFNLSQFANKVNTSGQASLTTAVTGTLPVANGGTGTATPSLVGGTNITISGSWPNQTVTAAGGAPTTAQVLTATAGASSDAVGTYAFLKHNTGGTVVSAGTNYAGSALVFSGAGAGSSSPASVTTGTSGSVPSGTWKAMGTTTPYDSGYKAITLFLRVS